MSSTSSASSAPGDSFTILFERFRDAEGDLLREAACCMPDSRWPAATSPSGATTPNSGPDWFDDQGRSLRRAFLRTPLDGARVTSGFGMRAHPVLGYTRQHQGIDFAAPERHPGPRRLGWGGGADRLAQRLRPRRHACSIRKTARPATRISRPSRRA